jgi:ribosomal protein S18 acetylase RimI-like enzyme
MEQLTIRKATLDDLDILLGFEQAVIAAERPFDITIKSGDVRYYDLEGLISAPHVEIVVAESGSEIIGSGYARIESSEPYLKHLQHAYLGFMYVVPGHRGKGVNKKIIEALEQWSISQDVTEMRLEVYINNLAAIKAYEKSGFTGHMLEMRVDLSEKEEYVQ